MKKRTIAMVLVAAMMVLAAGCQKEEATRVAPVNSVRAVEYSIDNTRQHVTIEGSAEWQALLGECLDRAAEGHLVNISHGAGANYAKERQVYATESRNAALAWVDARFNEGYDVTMWYDEEEGKYICVASKLAPPTGVAPNGFVYQPLQQYLPGEWTKSMDRVVTLAPGAAGVDLDPQYGILTMTWEQIYDFYKIEPGTPLNSGSPMLRITSDTITIVNNTTPNETIPYEIVSDMFFSVYEPNVYKSWKFRAYEWSQDTMLVFHYNGYNIMPYIYTRN